MNIDNLHFSRYFTLTDEENVIVGWKEGWEHFDRSGSPNICMDPPLLGIHQVLPSTLRKIPFRSPLWPDTKDYDQNSPGILTRQDDLARRAYKDEMDQAFWVNVLRVPVCVNYLAACAKVKPNTILELGTGGDSAHSTGMFLHYLSDRMVPALVSVDRHPLSHVWPRYRDNTFWTFIQGDSINVMKALALGRLHRPTSYDMIFIDSSHNHPHTKMELENAAAMTNAILLDDSTHPGVKESLDMFLSEHEEWLRVDLGSTVALLERHPYA